MDADHPGLGRDAGLTMPRKLGTVSTWWPGQLHAFS